MKSSFNLNFIDQLDNINQFNSLDHLRTVYHYSVPNTKLFYPEPFIASPSFMHSDLWFVHILLYQYWLWFVFIFIIVFFFLTFLSTIRWCNMRVRPRRETRGVSRSKCGDLITATVPVSWATSIIVNESTDAIDYYDGFGTTELVVGIRAYQWGWEYYYPKDVDLNYNLKPNYSIFTGNSLKYNKTTDTTLSSNNLWKFYQNKSADASLVPLFLLFSSFDNNHLINFVNFSEIGLNPLFESNAFKKIRVFSKSFTTNLSFTPSSYSLTYANLFHYYLGASQYSSSYVYGSKKQHNFLNTFSLFNNQTTFFNTLSFQKLLNRNYAANSGNADTALNTNFVNTKLNSGTPSSYESFKNLFLLKSNFSEFNRNTDKKQFFFTNYKLFNESISKTIAPAISNVYANGVLSRFLNDTAFFSFNDLSPKTSLTLLSSNQTVGTSEKTIRNFLKVSPQTMPLNFSTTRSNQSASLINLNLANEFLNISNVFSVSHASHLNSSVVEKLSSLKTVFDFPYVPVVSGQIAYSHLNYDRVKNSAFGAPLLLQGKEELMPSAFLTAYWNFYWANSGFGIKCLNAANSFKFSSHFYLPTFALYYDYDFRNWQSSELLEDASWETVYPFYSHFEYLDLKNVFNEELRLDKAEQAFNLKNRPTSALILNKKTSYTNFFFSEDFFLNLRALNTKNFNFFGVASAFTSAEEAYEASKHLNVFLSNSNLINLSPFFNFVTAHSSSTVLDSFRSDFDEYSWYSDLSSINFFSRNSKYSNYPFSVVFSDRVNSADTVFSNNSARTSNYLNLRNTAKNSIVTYNAMQKVFKTRFDENRSHARILDLANSFSGQPFLTTEKVTYEALLGKNKHNFFNTLFFKNSFKSFFSALYSLETGANFAFYDFPFLLALKSDSSRYIWFDWFAKWGYYEVQPSSSSRYAVFGMPYFSKNFEFSTPSNELLNESENYLIRISRARRNYLPNWTYAPYLYLKNTLWFKQNIFFYTQSLGLSSSLTEVFFILNCSSWFWNQYYLFNNTFAHFAPTNSNINSYARSASTNNMSTQGYYYLLTNLADILTKREYLYRELFFNKNKLVNLYSIFSNNPKNSLFFEIKSVLSNIDPISVNNEYSRDASFYALTAFKNTYFNTLFTSSFFTVFEKLFANYFSEQNSSLSASYKSQIFKDQYRPMRKGVSNMIRLHATGAMALPTEIRLQVLASSKDVIHSWAIPSAGIKIDCVPGYSSHRVMIFLVSGIYWGQCMEICGRYHHWMPIIVYFMKRDLFFLWCTHFIHFNPNATLGTNDRQYLDYTRTVSFDKSAWLLESNK